MGLLEAQGGIFKLAGYEPTKLQNEIHIHEGRVKLVAGGERAGKAVWVETRVPTPTGWRVMADLREGDSVFSEKGQAVRVNWASEVQYGHECYEVEFDTGEKIVADAAHLWAVQSESDRKNTNRKKVNGQEVWVKPPVGIEGRKYRILTTYQLTQETFIMKLKTKWGCGYLSNYSIPVTAPVEYKEEVLPIHPYLLGVWLGDGTSASGELTIGDSEIIERIEELGYDTYKTKSHFTYGIHGLVTALKGIGVVKNKHIPICYLESSVEQRLELLRGLMDTDGSATHKGNEFYNNNETLIDNVRELLSSLGIKNWKRSKRAKLYGKDCGIAYTLSFCTPLSVFHLSRKQERQDKTPAGHTQNRYIRSVRHIPSVPVKCISVDNSTGLYLSDEYIPTHNSVVNSKELLKHWYVDIAANSSKGLYWLLGNDYEACRGEWEHIVEDFTKLEVLAAPPTKNIDPGEIRLQDGTKIVTKSAKYPEKIATVAPNGILICEAAQVDYEVFLRAWSRLAEKRGWLCMAGTFEEEDYIGWYRELFELGRSVNQLDLMSFSLPTWSNLVIFPGGRQDPEILKQEAGMTAERFMERFGGEPCPKTGRVVTEFANAIHVKDVPFDKNLPVELAIDPGYAGAYAVLVIQDLGEQLALIDEIYVQGVVTQDIILICKKKEWWDAVAGGAIDIAGRQHQAMAAPVEIWIQEGVSLRSKKVNIEDGIDLLRTHLKQHPITGRPGIIVDPKCRGFISECGGGKPPVENGGIWMRDKHTLKPIERFDHACKALIYYLSNKYGFTGERKIPSPLKWVGEVAQPTFTRT